MTEIHGYCAPAFAAVRDGFAHNFAEGDLGAACAVLLGDDLVVDLWGGHRDVARTRPWERDTVVNVWSTTKPLAALCVLMLHDRGALSVDDPVARHWPEFAANGKERVLVRQLLGHTAGLPGFDEPLTLDESYDTAGCAARLAAQAPWWEPGTVSGYHSSTQGPLLGELVRRVDGRTLGTFFREEVAGPLGADVWIGTPASVDPRIAEMRTDEIPPPPVSADGVAGRVARSEPNHAPLVGTERWRRAERPASNGHGDARGIARILSSLARGGEVDGHRLLGPATIERIFEVQADGRDLVLDQHIRFGLGFGLPSPDTPLGVNDRTLWWGGWGGSMAVIDVENGLTVVYVMNRMMEGTTGGMRAGSLVWAAHGAAGRLREG